jgi:hypothetical protein
MPGYVGLTMMVGACAAALLQGRMAVRVAAAVLLGFVYVTTFFYGLGSSVDVARDTRIQVVEWFEKNVQDKKTSVVTLVRPWYGPYLPNGGFDNYGYPWTPPADWATNAGSLPKYVVTGYAQQVYAPARPFWEALDAGKLPYEKVAYFEQEHFWPKRTIFGFAGWPKGRAMQSSPPITVWQRKSSQ